MIETTNKEAIDDILRWLNDTSDDPDEILEISCLRKPSIRRNVHLAECWEKLKEKAKETTFGCQKYPWLEAEMEILEHPPSSQEPDELEELEMDINKLEAIGVCLSGVVSSAPPEFQMVSKAKILDLIRELKERRGKKENGRETRRMG